MLYKCYEVIDEVSGGDGGDVGGSGVHGVGAGVGGISVGVSFGVRVCVCGDIDSATVLINSTGTIIVDEVGGGGGGGGDVDGVGVVVGCFGGGVVCWWCWWCGLRVCGGGGDVVRPYFTCLPVRESSMRWVVVVVLVAVVVVAVVVVLMVAVLSVVVPMVGWCAGGVGVGDGVDGVNVVLMAVVV